MKSRNGGVRVHYDCTAGWTIMERTTINIYFAMESAGRSFFLHQIFTASSMCHLSPSRSSQYE